MLPSDLSSRAVFADSRLQEQVRLAIREWETALGGARRRDPQAPYGFARWTGPRGFFVLRTVVVHEVGHAPRSQHTDASWFNRNLMRNFRPSSAIGQLIAVLYPHPSPP